MTILVITEASMTSWGATAAKARFSEVMDKALQEGPQLVTRRREEVLMVSKADWDARGKIRSEAAGKKAFRSAWDALHVVLPPGPDLIIPRNKWKSRVVKF